jgi:hypothetical protein
MRDEAMRCFMERDGDEYRNDPDRQILNWLSIGLSERNATCIMNFARH